MVLGRVYCTKDNWSSTRHRTVYSRCHCKRATKALAKQIFELFARNSMALVVVRNVHQWHRIKVHRQRLLLIRLYPPPPPHWTKHLRVIKSIVIHHINPNWKQPKRQRRQRWPIAVPLDHRILWNVKLDGFRMRIQGTTVFILKVSC